MANILDVLNKKKKLKGNTLANANDNPTKYDNPIARLNTDGGPAIQRDPKASSTAAASLTKSTLPKVQ